MRDSIVGDARRFLLAGAANTALTAVIYILLLFACSPTTSYAIAWIVGIVFVMTVYPDKVFPGGRRQVRDRLALGAITISVFLVGLATIATLKHLLMEPILALVFTIAVTTTANFLLSRMLLRRSVEEIART